jgi:hypothetical protein
VDGSGKVSGVAEERPRSGERLRRNVDRKSVSQKANPKVKTAERTRRDEGQTTLDKSECREQKPECRSAEP